MVSKMLGFVDLTFHLNAIKINKNESKLKKKDLFCRAKNSLSNNTKHFTKTDTYTYRINK